jgi:hypothetical protein
MPSHSHAKKRWCSCCDKRPNIKCKATSSQQCRTQHHMPNMHLPHSPLNAQDTACKVLAAMAPQCNKLPALEQLINRSAQYLVCTWVQRCMRCGLANQPTNCNHICTQHVNKHAQHTVLPACCQHEACSTRVCIGGVTTPLGYSPQVTLSD